MEPAFDFWSILFLIAAAQGLFLSGMIFMRKSKVNHLLATLILSFSIMLLFYVAYWTHFLDQLPVQTGLLQGLTFTFGPLLYFYIRSSKKEVFFNWWHFLPFALYILHFLNWPNYQQDLKSQIATFQVSIQNAHLLIYTVLIFIYISKNKGVFNGALKLYKWRKKVSWLFAGYTVSFISYYILVWTNTLEPAYDYMISLASSFFIYIIGYHGFQKQEIIFKMYENGKYDKSSLSTSAADSILLRVKEMVVSEKLYLDSTLKLNDLAGKLSLSPNHVSQVINDLEEKNFTDFINEFRIKDAQDLLLTTDHKIIHIAFDCGFNNKTSFNNAFKKIAGSSPGSFRKNQAIAV